MKPIKLGLSALRVSALALTATFATGCATNIDGDEADAVGGDDVASNEAALATPNLYFRCHSTHWEPASASRMVASTAPGVYEITYDVKEPWMLSEGERCLLTETSSATGWGDWQKYYGTVDKSLVVPQGGLLATPVTDPYAPLPFVQLRYPRFGRYRVRVDLTNRAISAAEDASAPGSVSWIWPGQISMDASGVVYSTAYYPENKLERLDPTAGTPVWTKTLTKSVYLDTQCSRAGSLTLGLDGLVAALDLADGRLKWTSNLGGLVSSAAYFNVSCRDDDVVFVSHTNSTGISALRRSDGALLWTKTAERYISVTGTTATRVILADTSGDDTRMIGVDKTTGAQTWTYAPGGWFWSQLDTRGRLYSFVGAELTAIDATTGATLWTSHFDGDYPYLSLDNGFLTVTETGRVHRLDGATGGTRWSYATSGRYSNTTVLADGWTSVQAYTDAGGSELSLLSPVTGLPAWSKTFPEYARLLETKERGLYFLSKADVSRVDRENGNVLWNFHYDFPNSPAPQPYDSRGMSSIPVSDSNSIYVVYSGSGYPKYPPQGILALNVNSGNARWDRWEGETLWVVGSNATHLFLNPGGYGMPTRARAIRK
jgi:outer membrane protein assembly factor BamB